MTNLIVGEYGLFDVFTLYFISLDVSVITYKARKRHLSGGTSGAGTATLPEHMSSPQFLVGFVLLDL
jgi:hypothetical protein